MANENPVGPQQGVAASYNYWQYQQTPQPYYFYQTVAPVKSNREKALELAISSQEAGYPAETTVERAEAFFKFLEGGDTDAPE